MILTVHDEIVSEIRDDQAEDWSKIQADEMCRAASLFIKKVPVAAEPFDGDGRIYVADPANSRIQIWGDTAIGSERDNNESDSNIDINHSKSSSDWYKNGVRITIGGGGKILYQWVKGDNNHPKSDKWKKYTSPIKAKSGKNTLIWKVSGDTHHKYLKVKSREFIYGLESNINTDLKTVTLSWKSLGDSVKGFKIYRSDSDPDFNLDWFHLIGTNASNDNTFIINNPVSWKNFYYRIVAYGEDEKILQTQSIFVQVQP